MKKVETIKGTQSTPIRPSLTNPKKMSYDDVFYTESDFYLYWQQSSFSHIDKSQKNMHRLATVLLKSSVMVSPHLASA